jgi:hypothetical protein
MTDLKALSGNDFRCEWLVDTEEPTSDCALLGHVTRKRTSKYLTTGFGIGPKLLYAIVDESKIEIAEGSPFRDWSECCRSVLSRHCYAFRNACA